MSHIFMPFINGKQHRSDNYVPSLIPCAEPGVAVTLGNALLKMFK